MTGRVINVMNINEDYNGLTIQSLNSGTLMNFVVDRSSSENLLNGELVSINMTITKICNANVVHQYPEGTLGWDKKGI